MSERHRVIVEEVCRHAHWSFIERVIIRALFGIRITTKKGS